MRGHFARWRGWTIAFVVAMVVVASARADGREDYLVRLLESSNAFRVRAQAALSLGQLNSSRRSIAALERAARDSHPAVRVSAISSLRRLGAKAALPTIRQATRDRNKSVKRAARDAVAALEGLARRQRGPGPTRHLVAIGMPGTRSERVSRQMLFDARVFLAERLLGLSGVELAPDDLSAVDAGREIANRNLQGFYLESSVLSLRPRSHGVRAEVSVIVLTYPGRDMRAMLRGAATASGAYTADSAEQAIQGAFIGALRRLPQVFAAVQARGSL